MDEERPVRLVVDCSTGESQYVPMDDSEWAARTREVRQAEADRTAREQRDAELLEAVQAHPDPVVQELARRAGLV
jgi:hypothetical protein